MPSIKVRQSFFALAHNYNLYDHPSGEEFGIVRGKIFKIRPSFHAKTFDGAKFFKIQRNIWRTKYKIVDGNGKYLAHIKVPFIAFFRKKLHLYINNKRFKVFGNFWGLDFDIIDPETDQRVIEISKKLIAIRDSFLVTFPDNFDERIAIAAAIAADDRYHPN